MFKNFFKRKQKIEKDTMTFRLHVTPFEMGKKPSDIEILQDHGPMLAFYDNDYNHGNSYTLRGPNDSFIQWAKNANGFLMFWDGKSEDDQDWYFKKHTPK